MSLERAVQLRDMHRPEEAEAMLLQHLAGSPEDVTGHVELALTRYQMEGRGKDALESIQRAIGLEPDIADFFAIQSLIYNKLGKDSDSLAAAERAIALDAEMAFGWAAKGAALGSMKKWSQAEEACREALRLDADYEFALNQLAIFLRMQGKVDGSSAEVAARLERDAEDPLAHANAGWASFQSGDLKQAEVHFQEALRLDPSMEYARMGLRETFKARSVLYRGYLKWVFFLQKYSDKQQLLIVLGIFLAYRLGRGLLANIDTRLAIALMVLYLFFAFGTYLASGIGGFLLLRDKAARLTLNRKEKQEGLFVGGGFFLGLALIGLSFFVFRPLVFPGAALVLACIPGGMFWDNDSKAGRWVFGGLMTLVYGCGLGLFLSILLTGSIGDTGRSFISTALLASFGSTWLAMIPGLRGQKGE
ncbi:tetratricopeptide repeat protein [Roseibacillus persicicus]|uniref:tetratricopeptide repeat protein n=1 Tax=Roseibacillus persicicus TaxID=454148 RepID=UPI00280DB8D9|nr:tetratricopeptide repeat protein [Roseibacillus persicicus]MDQ8189559.1 tetratricopeptide repeat protein [Roseibacillus persicicus]